LTLKSKNVNLFYHRWANPLYTTPPSRPLRSAHATLPPLGCHAAHMVTVA